MNGIIEVLGNLRFNKDESNQALHDFLYSTMDETRMLAQSSFSKSVLKETGMDDWEYFRQSIANREVNNIISYEKQRDHGSHTVYNFLLGHYIYKNSPLFKNSLKEYSELRYCQNHLVFESLWGFVSLLHDIGYMFEGSISNTEPVQQNALISLGADILNAYFDQILWNECGIHSVRDKEYLLNLADNIQPPINKNSIFTISNSLRELGCLKKLQENTNLILTQLNLPEIKSELSNDVFDIWIQNLEYYNKNWLNDKKRKIVKKNPFPSLIVRIKVLQKYFADVQTVGYKKIGARNIDHAVASGLVLLKCSTLFFQITNAIELNQLKNPSLPVDPAIQLFTAEVNKDSKGNGYVYNSEWWWLGITWATMAAAYHNFPLMRDLWPNKYEIPKLSYKDDPLMYLGILVDILQEWDRYSSSNNSLTTKKAPLQGIDIQLGTVLDKKGNQIIVISYPDNFETKEIKKKLNSCLINWRHIIRIDKHHIETVKEKDNRASAQKIIKLLEERKVAKKK